MLRPYHEPKLYLALFVQPHHFREVLERMAASELLGALSVKGRQEILADLGVYTHGLAMSAIAGTHEGIRSQPERWTRALRQQIHDFGREIGETGALDPEHLRALAGRDRLPRWQLAFVNWLARILYWNRLLKQNEPTPKGMRALTRAGGQSFRRVADPGPIPRISARADAG